MVGNCCKMVVHCHICTTRDSAHFKAVCSSSSDAHLPVMLKSLLSNIKLKMSTIPQTVCGFDNNCALDGLQVLTDCVNGGGATAQRGEHVRCDGAIDGGQVLNKPFVLVRGLAKVTAQWA